MPLLRIDTTAKGLTLHDTPQPAARRLCAMASQPGPAIIMVHGYKYAPGTVEHCPHKKIFGDTTYGWPAQLGFGAGDRDEGLGIALGWYARGPLKSVHKRAAELGENIAVMVAMLRAHTPGRPVHIIAHSLGSEAALSALAHLPERSVNRLVLLTGASYAGRAKEMLDTPAGRSAEVLNITSRENDLFDAAFEHLIRSDRPGDRAIGQGIAAPNVATVQLDCAETLAGFGRLGFKVAATSRRICHWSAYKRPGVMALYNTFLRNPNTLPLEHLKQAMPECAAPRWSRLFSVPRRKATAKDIALPLPSYGVVSSQHLTGVTLTRRPTNEPAC